LARPPAADPKAVFGLGWAGRVGIIWGLCGLVIVLSLPHSRTIQRTLAWGLSKRPERLLGLVGRRSFPGVCAERAGASFAEGSDGRLKLRTRVEMTWSAEDGRGVPVEAGRGVIPFGSVLGSGR